MSSIMGDSGSYFSKDSYEAYLNRNTAVCSARLRSADETIFAAVASGDADFTQLPEGKEIVETIRNYR